LSQRPAEIARKKQLSAKHEMIDGTQTVSSIRATAKGYSSPGMTRLKAFIAKAGRLESPAFGVPPQKHRKAE
jgi:hypothetical protein